MKKIYGILMLAMLAICSVALVSCGDDDDDIGGNSPIVGSWEGTNGTWTFIYTFEADGHGSGRGWTGRGSEYAWEFVWSGKSTVKCKGVSVYHGFDGEVTTNDKFETTFKVSGNTMTGGQFSNVTFTKR